MSYMGGPALLYVVFAFSFLLFSIMMGVQTSSEMYQAAVRRFVETPWQQRPTKRLLDVDGGLQVYDWITSVFVDQLYKEQATPLDKQAYCTEASHCVLGEGDVDKDSHCAGSLVAGSDNCPSYMGSGRDCCEQCTGPTCPSLTITTKAGDLTNTTAGQDLSENCANGTPSWLLDISQWTRPGSAGRRLSGQSEEMIYCPERLSKVASDIDTRTKEKGSPIMLAEYNRVLMGRMTLKRMKIVRQKSKAFANAYPQKMRATSTNPYKYQPSDENTESFGDRSVRYTYESRRGFAEAGGFVQYLDFDSSSKEQILAQVAELNRDHWFDLNQGAFVLDMIVYNGNVNKFLYIAFVFEHDFSGKTIVSVNTSPLDLALHELSQFATWVRFLIYLAIFVLFCYFVKVEFEDLSSDWTTYFTDITNLMQVLSLGLSAYCFVLYMTIVVSYGYIHFEFPMATEMPDRIKEYEDLASLATRMETFMTVISVNTCCILVRCLSVMTMLVPSSGIVFNAIAKVKYSLLAFCTMFGVMLAGFTFASYLIFGTKRQEYSTIVKAFVSAIKMLMKESTYADLKDGDSDMCFTYFLVFQVFFLIVQQLLLSIIIKGYFLEKGRIEQLQEADKYPLRRFWRVGMAWIREYSTWINRCAVSLQQAVFGAGGVGHTVVNYENVAKLRDRRATRPRIRNVVYEQKQDEEVNAADVVAKDFTLRAEWPFYPGGMMHYYVEAVSQNGAAQDANVQPGFHLVEIQHSGINDRERFREPEVFEASGEDPQKLLRDRIKRLPVTLVFEGSVKPVSWECAGLLYFLAIFLTFAIMVCRVDDSHSQFAVHKSALLRPHWYAFGPKQQMSFEGVQRMDEVSGWLSAAVVDKEYACAGGLGDPGTCGEAGPNGEVREGWFFWHGVGGEELPREVAGEDTQPFKPVAQRPVAAEGLSAGFLPLTAPIGPEATSTITQTVRMNEHNIGVMPNNHVRLTFQVPCFQRNKNPRWALGYQYRLDPVIAGSTGCAGEACMQEMVEEGRECLNAQGEPQDKSALYGEWSHINYTFGLAGTYHELGGFAVGFGNTQHEASMLTNLIRQDEILKRNAVSSVFEFVTYNANFDMFTYSAVTFNLKPTGKLEKSSTTSVFPLNIFSMGSKGGAGQERVVNWLCLFAYIGAAMIFTGHLALDLWTQYKLTSALLRPPYMFLFDFFTEDWWNVVDVVSVALNIAVIDSIFRYMLISSSVGVLGGIESWTGKYRFSSDATLNTVDPVLEFERAAEIYRRFSGLASVNGLFLLARFVKYFGGLASLRLVLRTLASAVNEIIIMLAIFCIILLGFVFMFFTRFGIQFTRFGTMDTSFINLFLFLVGRFDVDDLIQNSPSFFLFIFPVYQLLFFLLLNLLLAAIIFRWKDARRDAQEFSLLSTWRTLKESLAHPFTPQAAGRDQEASYKRLDVEFWQKLAILRYIHRMNDSGKITVPRSNEKAGKKRKADAREEPHEDAEDSDSAPEEPGMGFNLENPDDQKKFLKAFKKAHMELASRMCRNCDGGKPDKGGGVNLDPDYAQGGGDQGRGWQEDGAFIGIIEELQKEERETKIVNDLTKKLEDADHLSEEVWLDALLTVLEEARALEKLQGLFLPPPMIFPKKPQEWANFNQKKVKMERRLNLFLAWLQEEARLRHYMFLRKMADAKETVLKQQSLVLTDYLEQIDAQIEKCQEEIKDLERKNAHMRSPVAHLVS